MESNLNQQKSIESNLNIQKSIESNLNQQKSIEFKKQPKKLNEIIEDLHEKAILEKENKDKSLNNFRTIKKSELANKQISNIVKFIKLNDQQPSKLKQSSSNLKQPSSKLEQKKENIKFSDLSNELIGKILDFFSLKELIKFKLINKKFKSICESKLENKDCLLLFTNSRISSAKFLNNWFYTNERQTKDNLIRINSNFELKQLEDKFKIESIFKNLRRLFINLTKYEDNLNMNKTINQLKELEQLDIEFRIKLNSVLNLPKLRILNVNGYNHSNLILKTPMLSIMKCKFLKENYYHFTYPKKMIYLVIENGFSADCLNELCNLEYLFSNNYTALELDQLIKLTKLKELHLCSKDTIQETIQFNYSTLDKFKIIYEEKLRLNLANLNLFISGVKYEKIYKINNRKLKNSNQNELIINNLLNLINVLPFVEEIDYTRSFKQFKNHHLTIDDLFIKFPNIKSVIANRILVNNVTMFFKFISNYNLTHLTLTNPFNKQIYYDQLPEYSKTIIYLCLNTDDSIDYGFVTDYKYLAEFETSRELDANAIDNLFNNLDSLIKIDFINDCNFVDVEYDRDRIETKYYIRLFKTKEYANAKLKEWVSTTDEMFKSFNKKIIEPKKLPIKIIQ